MSERTEFDPQGRILSRSFVDGKVWSYSYLDKVRLLIKVRLLGILFSDFNAFYLVNKINKIVIIQQFFFTCFPEIY